MNPRLNKKVKKDLDAYFKGYRGSDPEVHHGVKHILIGALRDANFHSEAKKVDSMFPKAKQSKFYGKSSMEDSIEQNHGEPIAKAAKWDGHDIIDAIAFFVSMFIGGPVGAKVTSLKEGMNENFRSFVTQYIKEVTHSHEYEDMSSMGEDENDVEEVKVGEYQSKYFHICAHSEGASELYKNIESKGVDMDIAERSVRLQDALFFIEEHIQREGYNPERDYSMVANNIAKNIMKMAKIMGLEQEHSYIQSHVDTIEQKVNEINNQQGLTEGKSMDMKARFKIYDKLKKGDEITIKYGSSMSSGNEAKFKVTKGKTLVGKQKVERIILQNVANPKGVKYYLYQRNGNVTMAIGNMAATIEDINESVNESLNHNDMYTMLDIAAGYSSTQHEAAGQMWSDEQDLYDYLKSDHIPKKYHKKFHNDIKRRFKNIKESVNEGSVANKWNIQSQDIGKLQKKTSFSSETSMPFSLISNLSGGVNSTDKGIVSGHFNKDVVILQFYPKEDSRNDTMYDAVDKKGIIAIDKLMKKQYGLSMVSPFLLKGKRHCSADGEVCSVSNYLVFGGTNESIEERVNLFLEKNVPTDASKWSYYKSQAKKKFDVYPSAYANGWAAKKYKAAGGGWKTEK